MGGCLISLRGLGPDGQWRPWETNRRKEIGKVGIKGKKEGRSEEEREGSEADKRSVAEDAVGRYDQSVGFFRLVKLSGNDGRLGVMEAVFVLVFFFSVINKDPLIIKDAFLKEKERKCVFIYTKHTISIFCGFP